MKGRPMKKDESERGIGVASMGLLIHGWGRDRPLDLVAAVRMDMLKRVFLALDY